MRCLGVLLCVFVVAMGTVSPAAAQQDGDLPEAVQEELDRRGLTSGQARQRLQQLGIDPSNPQQAAQRARELGVPEARIQALLEAARNRGQGGKGDSDQGKQEERTAQTPSSPTLAGQPTIDPTDVSVKQLPQDVQVTVPLRSGKSIKRVSPYFLTPTGERASVLNVERVQGSSTNGTWQGNFAIPASASVGQWSLFVRVETENDEFRISTGRRIRIVEEESGLDYFGYDTFEIMPSAFEPQTTGPVDGNYVVGTEDELRLTVWGAAEFTHDLQVDREGRVMVPNVGQFTVEGKQLDELRTEMKQWLSRSYSGLTSDPPTVFMDLSLTRVRPSRVFVLGEVAQPGGYTVSSYATVFNALYSVGGPLQRGTLRNIRVIRNGEAITTVDLYEYLMDGYSPGSVQLQSNDYVFVPPRGKTVAIRGAVKRPAYYEMKEGETVQDLLKYAGGLEPNAYAKRFQIERIAPFDERQKSSVSRKVMDFSLRDVQSDTAQVSLADGDRVRIFTIGEAQDPAVKARIQAVEVTGAVYQPGRYELERDIRTVKDLIEQADGLTGDAYREQADLVRIDDTLNETTQPLNLDAVMEDEPQDNVVLQPGDSLHVRSVREMNAVDSVLIYGVVEESGAYRYRKGMTVRDLLLKGGGLMDNDFRTQVFLGRADLYRFSDNGSTERVIPFHLGDALKGKGMADRKLQPSDEIRIYPAKVERIKPRTVRISGAVERPDRYVLRENTTLKDLIAVANGFSESASLQKVEVTRMVEKESQEGRRAKKITVPLIERDVDPKDVNFSVGDTARALEAAADFQLQHRDKVFVRQDPSFKPQETVTIRGEVKSPGKYTLLTEKERLSDVIQRAGGVLPTGYLQGGRLRRDGEQVIVEMRQVIQGGNPDEDVILKPDDEIVIPTQPNTVAIRGNVANEGRLKYEPGRRVEYYLDRVGGVRDSTKAVFLTQASGATFKVGTGWFRRSPVVEDGAVIRVKKKSKREQVDYVEIVSNVSQILSSTITVLVLARRFFN